MFGVLRAILGYYFLIFMMRIAGRRPGKQLTPMEFVLVFFSGGLTLTTIVADDRSLTNALGQITAIATAHFVLIWLRGKFPRFGRIVDSVPLVLLAKGRWSTETMREQRIADDDVMAMARDKGLQRLDQIDYAVLERSGEISIISGEKT